MSGTIMEDQLKERIKFMTEMLRLTWLSLLAATTGTVGLLLGQLGTKQRFFVTCGLVSIAGFVVAVCYLINEIKTLINQLGEG